MATKTRNILSTTPRVLSVIFASLILLSLQASAQRKQPLPEDYPVSKSDVYKGKPVRPLLGSKRARMYRTVLRQGAKEGPNFAGRYTLVTWGAGLGVFSMAIVDAKSGNVYFPPFRTIGNTAYGMPFLDTGDNPAWRINSKLFAFVGRPDVHDKGMGLYVYSFDRPRFRLLYFEKEDEKRRKANQEAWEKEIDRRLASMVETFESLRKHLSDINPNVRCLRGHETRYGEIALDVICTEGDLLVSINLNYVSTLDQAAERIKSELQVPSLLDWRSVDGLGEQGIETDHCSRAWIRFRKGTYYVWMNANLNREEKEDPNCSGAQNVDSKQLAEFERRIAFVLADLLK